MDLNAQRALEEQRGLIRWLRPDYQNPQGQTASQQAAELDNPAAAASETSKLDWPKTLPEQVQALRTALDQHPDPASADQLARTFKRAQLKRIAEILETLVAIGQARKLEGELYAAV
ncbi:MAG: hypothetical protein H7842_00675 [Gammaproteobacteria bacterium SHHR-1]|uniref:hypothetical protein n=1 Tax=Magnetovirga frankeli TaxID=947516 RepID=UPI0012934191|nr:hypothetical protein D5125_12335 [gamma proteobacterium SS-5]